MISTAGRYAACTGNSYSALPEGRSFISAGTQTRTGGELKTKDLGMQGSKISLPPQDGHLLSFAEYSSTGC
ncbi:MAG: hypothetical protein K6E60_00295 [Saccharofermentans sp.]|nr:hypothetical protein [Saccharofermentans sp.]